MTEAGGGGGARRVIVLCAIGAALSCALGAPSAALAETYGSISGTVTEASSGKPIKGIGVCASAVNVELLLESSEEPGHYAGCTETDAAGAYTIGELQAEKYDVRFEAPPFSGLNYVAQFYEGKVLESEATPVAVVAGATTANIDAKLEPGASIAGTVTAAATGAPIEHAVAIVARPVGEGHYQLVQLALTNANGEYLAAGIPSGEAVVAFVARGYQAQIFDHKANPSEATVLSLTAPNLTSGINAALIPESPGESSSGSGSGTTSPAGAPAGTPLPKASTPEGTLSLLRDRIAVGAKELARVKLGCGGSAPCRAKVTLRARRAIVVKGHKRFVSVVIGTSGVLSIGASKTITAKVALNRIGRRMLRAGGGVLRAELTLVTAGRRQQVRVVLRARA